MASAVQGALRADQAEKRRYIGVPDVADSASPEGIEDAEHRHEDGGQSVCKANT